MCVYVVLGVSDMWGCIWLSSVNGGSELLCLKYIYVRGYVALSLAQHDGILECLRFERTCIQMSQVCFAAYLYDSGCVYIMVYCMHTCVYLHL